MSTGLFRELFKNRGKQSIRSGDIFPDEIRSEAENNDQFILFLSLTCSICISILNEIAIKKSGLHLQLYILGNDVEVKQLSKTITNIKLTSITEIEAQTKYKVFATPYYYRVDSHGLVITSKEIDSLVEII